VGKPLGGIEPHPKEIRRKAFALFQQGNQFVDIAYEIGVAAPTVRSWAMREHWRQQVKIAQEQPELKPEEIVAIARRGEPLDIPEELSEQQKLYQGNMAAAAIAMSERVKEMDADEALSKSSKIKDLDAVARKALKLETEKPAALIQLNILARKQTRVAHANVALRNSRQ
jgi:hypothetical protein